MISWIIWLIIGILVAAIFRNNPKAKIWNLYYVGKESERREEKVPFWGAVWTVIEWIFAINLILGIVFWILSKII
jgi:hypothetical protein